MILAVINATYAVAKRKPEKSGLLCVCPVIDHNEEPIKMRVEFSILYKVN